MKKGGEANWASFLEEMAPGIADAFRLILIAEEEITAAILKSPMSAEALNGAFRCLQPSHIFRGLHEKLYRAYCRELLERVIDGTSLDIATKAEVLVALSRTSLRAPLNRNALVLYEKLFAEVFGDEYLNYVMDGYPPAQSDYPGSEQEVFVDITRKLGRIRRSGPP